LYKDVLVYLRNSVHMKVHYSYKSLLIRLIIIFHGLTVLVGLWLLNFEVSRSHSDTPHSVELLWTSDQPSQRPLPDNTNNRHTSTLPAGFEPAIPVSQQPQTHALDRAVTGCIGQ